MLASVRLLSGCSKNPDFGADERALRSVIISSDARFGYAYPAYDRGDFHTARSEVFGLSAGRVCLEAFLLLARLPISSYRSDTSTSSEAEVFGIESTDTWPGR